MTRSTTPSSEAPQSEALQRWRFESFEGGIMQMTTHVDGDWVLYKDVASLLSESAARYREALSHIIWIKDCGIDSSRGNHPDAERDAMYRIAKEALNPSPTVNEESGNG